MIGSTNAVRGGSAYYADVYITSSTGASNLSGITVTITSGSNSYSSVTDANGRCQIQGQKNKTYTVTAYKEFFVFTPTSATITLNAPVVDVSFTCYKAPTFIGTCTGVDVSGRTITLVPTSGTTISVSTDLTGNTDEVQLEVNKTYTISSDYPTGQGVSPVSTSITTVAETTYTASFQILAKPTDMITVNDTSGSGKNSGLIARWVPTSGTTITATTNSSGVATATLLSNVAYTVSVIPSTGYMISNGYSITPLAGTDYTHTFTTDTNPTVIVTVSDASSQGYQAGRVVVMSDGTDSYSATTNASGVAVVTIPKIGTFYPSMSNVPTGGTAEFSAVSVETAMGGEYSMSCEISFKYVFGLKISMSNSDPASACVYTDDALGYTPMSNSGTEVSSGSWYNSKLIKDIIPVQMSTDGNHTESELSHTNLNLLVDGSTSANSAYDKFTKIPKKYLSLNNDGNYIYIKFSNVQVDSTYSDWYFSYNGVVQNNMYIACYLQYNTNNLAYSRTGVSPSSSFPITSSISYTQGRGTGYDMFRYNQLIFVQCLYLMLFKTRNSQTGLGLGYTGVSAKSNTGANNTLINEYGMYGSISSSTIHVSFLWIEDIWGNLLQWIGGMQSDSSRRLLVSDKSAVSSSGWEIATNADSNNKSGWISSVAGTQKGGFVVQATNGSDTTYWCDYGYLGSSSFPGFGGSWDGGSYAGVFFLYVYYSAAGAAAGIGSRLSYGGA